MDTRLADPRPGPAGGADAPARRSVSMELLALVGVALAITFLVRLLVVQAFYIPSGSMEPTLHVGDRVRVSKLSYRLGDVQRGDVVVFDGRGSFAPLDAGPDQGGALAAVGRSVGTFLGVAPSERDFVKRVVGLPGDRVVCCDAAGLLTVNGRALREPYLPAGEPASAEPFDVVVPAGRLWVMGDHRSDSADSRAHLGDPGGGTVPLDRVVGKVLVRFWPLARLGGHDEMAADDVAADEMRTAHE
jgi:signal peptidase I